MPYELQATLSNVIPFSFYVAAAVTAQTTTALGRAGEATASDVPYAIVPWKGHIVGVSAAVEADRACGNCLVAVTVDGTAITPALSATIDGTNLRRDYNTVRKGVHAIAAGSYVGATYTTPTTWDGGTTPSLIVDIFVAVDEDSGTT